MKLISLLFLFMNLYGATFGQEPTTPIPPTIVVAKLVHYQALASPLYDPSKSMEELADLDFKSSMSRALYLTSANRSLDQQYYPMDIDTKVIPAQQPGFLALFHVGSAVVEQWVFMDTGSNLLWINCRPSDSNVPSLEYDPKESTSYETEDCESYRFPCTNTGTVIINCDPRFAVVDGCTYYVLYGGDYSSRGKLARETFQFGEASTETLRSIVFGCAKKVNKFYVNGVLGLGSNKISLLSQYGATKFSYCIGDLYDRSYQYNELVIGDKVQLWGDVTPLIIDSKYYIILVGITVGSTPLVFDPNLFAKTKFSGGMIVDSAASLSFIPQVVLGKFQAAIIREMGFTRVPKFVVLPNQKVARLCYDGSMFPVMDWFPLVKFQFKDGATMILTPDNFFQQINRTLFCLSIVPSDGMGTSILGVMAQQNFYIAFDLKRQKISFKRIDCKSVQDYYAHDEL